MGWSQWWWSLVGVGCDAVKLVYTEVTVDGYSYGCCGGDEDVVASSGGVQCFHSTSLFIKLMDTTMAADTVGSLTDNVTVVADVILAQEGITVNFLLGQQS